MTAYVQTIERIKPPSKREFEAKYVRQSRPAIIVGLMDQWPASQTWTPQYLAKKYGHLPAAVVKLKDGRALPDTKTGVVYEPATFGRAMELVTQPGPPENYFVARMKGPLKPIMDEVSEPPYCHHGPLFRSRLFVGAAGTITGLHRDFPENLFAQVYGHKRFTLVPPDEKKFVHKYPLLSKLPQASPVDAEQPDYAKHPRFRNAHPITVELKAGEMLYLPSSWWHQVRSLDQNISINWWWPNGLRGLLKDGGSILGERLHGVRW